MTSLTVQTAQLPAELLDLMAHYAGQAASPATARAYSSDIEHYEA